MTFRLFLDPADNFMVRDGRPFNQDDAGQAAAVSRFPPPPDTVYGATRVALARALGWLGVDDWTRQGDDGDVTRKAVLGGKEEEATFRIAGPFFEVAGTDLLPLPATLYARTRKCDGKIDCLTLCKPGSAAATDNGHLRLLALPDHDEALEDHSLAGRWGPAAAVEQMLLGSGPPGVGALTVRLPGPRVRRERTLLVSSETMLPGVTTQSLGVAEARIGLERNNATRAAVDGRLYASTRRVLPPGVRMYVVVDGIDVGSERTFPPVPLGGEGRFVFPERRAQPQGSQTPAVRGTYLVMLTTPAILPPLEMGGQVSMLPGTLAAVAVTGVSTTAGFERGTGGRGRSTGGVQVLPPGTVLYMANADGRLPNAIGERVWRGYGRFHHGVWNG